MTKKHLSILLLTLLLAQAFAFNPKKTSTENMYKDVQKNLGHKIEKYEKNIIDTTYLYYHQKCSGNWTKEIWTTAVSKSTELCNNKAAIAAAKAGEFGEKLLQSIIVTTEDIFSGFNDWLDKNSEEYKKRHP
jgi:DNA-directed RNA polymerase beta' subunit